MSGVIGRKPSLWVRLLTCPAVAPGGGTTFADANDRMRSWPASLLTFTGQLRRFLMIGP